MQNAIAAPERKGMQPQPGQYPYNALYFVAYIVVSVFVVLNLYIGACSSCLQEVDRCNACRTAHGAQLLKKFKHSILHNLVVTCLPRDTHMYPHIACFERTVGVCALVPECSPNGANCSTLTCT
jgi:hypothetical protein